MTMTSRTGPAPWYEIQVEARGDLPGGVGARARAKVSALLDGVRRPVLFARIRLLHVNNPATERPYVAQVNVDLSGRLVRAHLAARTADEAVDPHPRAAAFSGAPMTVDPLPAPVMDLPAARRRLEALGERFLFFADASTGRGKVLYHRYDGHYGLITPAGPPPRRA